MGAGIEGAARHGQILHSAANTAAAVVSVGEFGLGIRTPLLFLVEHERAGQTRPTANWFLRRS